MWWVVLLFIVEQTTKVLTVPPGTVAKAARHAVHVCSLLSSSVCSLCMQNVILLKHSDKKKKFSNILDSNLLF